MCSQNPDGTITTCSSHDDLSGLTEKLAESVEHLSIRVSELEQSIKLLRNAAFLLIGLMMGTGVLQVKEVLTLLGSG